MARSLRSTETHQERFFSAHLLLESGLVLARPILARLLFAIASLVITSVTALAGDDWKPVDPAHLALKAPVVDKDAGAEAIFWEVQVEFSFQKTVFVNYLRIKIFTDRGKELCGKVELPYTSKDKVDEIAGRTIRADGTIVELKKEAIFDSILAKRRGVKISAKTFAMPAVEPGAIIEYRWREVRHEPYGIFVRLSFQRDIPVQLVKYTLKPPSTTFPGFRTKAFNMENTPAAQEKDKRVVYTMTNVRPFQAEPHMPPENQVRRWMLAYYEPPQYLIGADYNKAIYDDYKSRTKLNDEVKQAAQKAIGDASTPDQKLERLFEYCRTRIKDIRYDAALIAGDLAKFKENKTAADTLKRGMGTGEDIDLLFAALATAAGFDARLAHVADRSDIFFSPYSFEFFLNFYFMRAYDVAVRVGNGWRFFDPASRYVPCGMLRWQEEGVKASLVDPAMPVTVETPISPAEKSVQKRTANLRLSDDGTIEGDVRMEYTGHLGVEKRRQNADASMDEQQKNLREMIKEQLSTAELSNIGIENVTDPLKPFIYTFHVRVPGYAQRTGKRLFLQPEFFEAGAPALFFAGERNHPIYFHYYWREDDKVTIQLPTGYALDHADRPPSFTADNLAKYEANILVVGKGEALDLKRTFNFEALIFPVKSYSGLKRFFDAVHEADNHTITLKQETPKQ
jgi:hypothetical protein